MKFVVVSGGTVSGLGKGTAISSLGVVLRAHGYRVTSIKIDPYLNIDAGTMSPFEHGEVYVLEDGGEADLDLGNYERFLDVTLTSRHNITSGKIYDQVIKRERAGDYLGKTVQMVPHVTDAVQSWILEVASIPVDGQPGSPDICLIELGGTVGDIESAVYLEALQQLQYKVGSENFCNIHVGMVPVMGVVGEQKTKPCQHSVKLLREAGIKPDFLFCRADCPLEDATRSKLALFCQTPPTHVMSLHDVSNIYRVPLLLHEQRAGELVLARLGLIVDGPTPGIPMSRWQTMAARWDHVNNHTQHAGDIKIGIVGKYNGLSDSYLSVIKGLQHAALEASIKMKIVWIDATSLEPNTKETNPGVYEAAWGDLKSVDGVLVPGGFGDRGVQGKVLAGKYCRDTNVPYFGICLGLQTAVIGYARDHLGYSDANSAEFDPATKHPVVMFMPEQTGLQMGGTMRLGNRVTIIKDTESLAFKLYGKKPVVYERHRHRYEVNPQYVAELEAKGLRFSGHDDRGQRMEIAELPGHKFFIAAQFHPEFTSRPLRPNPLFLGFVLASAGNLQKRFDTDGGCLVPGSGWSA
jgi:CTP synthase